MNGELREALEEWNDNSAIQSEWERITSSPVFRTAIRLERLKIQDNLETTDIEKHTQLTDRTLFGLRGGLRALSNLESLADIKQAPPQPLPAPWSYAANPINLNQPATP